MSYSSIPKKKSGDDYDLDQQYAQQVPKEEEAIDEDEKKWCCSISYYQRLISFFNGVCLYLAFVIVIWMSELVIGMLSYTYMDEVRSDLSRNLVKPIQRYYHVRNPDEKFNQHVDFIQTRLRCCGANSPQDWNHRFVEF